MSTERSRTTGMLIVVVAAALFAMLGVLSRTAYAEGIVPFSFVTWRAGIGAVGIWSVALWLDRRGRPLMPFGNIDRDTRIWLAVAIVVGAGLNLAVFLAFQRTTVALVLLGFYTYPAMVAAANVLLRRERLDSTHVLALGLALVGMAAVVLGGVGASEPLSAKAGDLAVDTLGDVGAGVALALLAALLQAVFVVISRGYSAVPTHQAMATILAGTTLVAALVTIVASGPAALVAPFASGDVLVLLAVTGVFAAALPSVLFLTGIRRIGGTRTGILMLFEPVVGVALAAAFLGEGITLVQLLGGATVLLAAGLVQGAGAADAEGPAVVPAPGGP